MAGSTGSVDIQTVKAAVLLSLLIGFLAGYKAKELRLKWIRFRRDRLSRKLADTQKQLDLM